MKLRLVKIESFDTTEYFARLFKDDVWIKSKYLGNDIETAENKFKEIQEKFEAKKGIIGVEQVLKDVEI